MWSVDRAGAQVMIESGPLRTVRIVPLFFTFSPPHTVLYIVHMKKLAHLRLVWAWVYDGDDGRLSSPCI